MNKNVFFTSVIITAAGNSSRMGNNDKLLLKIQNKTILEYTIESFEKAKSVDEIIIVTREDLIPEIEYIIKKNNYKRIKNIVVGGNCRQQSVYNGFLAINKKADFVSVHDGARPFITAEEIDEIHKNGYEFKAVCCGTSIKDTVKKFDENGFIVETLDRNSLISVATPQIFDVKLYKQAVEKINFQFQNFTDDAGIVEQLGYKIKIVKCSYENIKITTKEDLSLAKIIIERRQKNV